MNSVAWGLIKFFGVLGIITFIILFVLFIIGIMSMNKQGRISERTKKRFGIK